MLDLAIEFDNKDFVADRFCQRVLDELWWGHSPNCGAVRLRHEPAWWRIYASPLATLFCIRLLPLEANDLHPFPAGARRIGPLRQMLDLYQIPLIKRSNNTVSFLFFLGLFVFGFAFLPMCGPLTLTHVIACGWLLTIAAEEAYLCFQSYSLWKSNRMARVFALALALLFLGCLLRFYQRDAHVWTSHYQQPSITQLMLELSHNGTWAWAPSELRPP